MSGSLRTFPVSPNDPRFSEQWALRYIRCPEAWSYTTGDASIIVAVLDTGVDLNHPDLEGRLLPGRSFVEGDPPDTPQDYEGHGTQVTGIIGACTNNELGIAGVTWHSQILPVKIHGKSAKSEDLQNSSVHAVQAAQGIRWAIEKGASIINISNGIAVPPMKFWRGTDEENNLLYNALREYKEAIDFALSKGCIVVAAAGQSIRPPNSVYPAAWPGVVAVGAIEPDGKHWGYSHTGAHIQFVAPGVDIWTTELGGDYIYCNTPKISGTSLAAPHVAGVAALVKSANPSLMGSQVIQILQSTTHKTEQEIYNGLPHHDYQYGYGIVNAERAVMSALGLMC